MLKRYLFQPVERSETCLKLLEVYPLISKKSRKIRGKFLESQLIESQLIGRAGDASAPTHHRPNPRPYSSDYDVGAGAVDVVGGGACAARAPFEDIAMKSIIPLWSPVQTR